MLNRTLFRNGCGIGAGAAGRDTTSVASLVVVVFWMSFWIVYVAENCLAVTARRPRLVVAWRKGDGSVGLGRRETRDEAENNRALGLLLLAVATPAKGLWRN